MKVLDYVALLTVFSLAWCFAFFPRSLRAWGLGLARNQRETALYHRLMMHPRYIFILRVCGFIGLALCIVAILAIIGVRR